MLNEKAAADKRELNSQAGEPVGLTLALAARSCRHVILKHFS